MLIVTPGLMLIIEPGLALSNRAMDGRTDGLCAACVFARAVGNQRGSTFVLCTLSRTRPDFPKYPRLPVLRCGGYQKRSSEVEATEN